MEKIKKFIQENRMFVISMIVLLGGQMMAYYIVKFFQTNPHYIDYYLDDKIPFIGYFIYIYDFFYPFLFISLFYLYKKDRKAYYKGAIAGTMGYIICNIIFLIYPTIMYRPIIPNVSPITDFIIKFTYTNDAPPLNCFPSIHCLLSFQVIYSYFSAKINVKTKLLIALISLLIIVSTLFVKQHYIFDVVSAFLICIITNLLEDLLKIYQRLKKKLSCQ